MNITFKKILASGLVFSFFSVTNIYAGGKTYSENEFLDNFGGKTKQIIRERLGEPDKKELSVKPSNAGAMMPNVGADDEQSKKVKVEMWYYKNIVRYDAKHTYKETEISFVNDQVRNIAFFNNR
jgi:hypothetical protein